MNVSFVVVVLSSYLLFSSYTNYILTYKACWLDKYRQSFSRFLNKCPGDDWKWIFVRLLKHIFSKKRIENLQKRSQHQQFSPFKQTMVLKKTKNQNFSKIAFAIVEKITKICDLTQIFTI